MTSYLLDTHIWVWDLKLDEKLSRRLIEMMDSSVSIHVSVVSIYEIAQKVRLGKWQEMSESAGRLADLITDQGYLPVNVTPGVAQRAGLLDWDHRDPFDRLIAATAIELQLPLISADTAFDALIGLPDWPGRIW